jgi:hypothetical protein
MQKPKPLLNLQDDNAAVLAAWYAVAYDLQHVISATKSLVILLQQPDSDGTVVRSLWSSALISYVRCFGEGRRARLEPSIYAHLLGDPIGTHQYYKDTRDKHIAHPVNAFEEVQVGVVTGDFGEPVGIGHLAVFRVCDDQEGVAQLGRLASVAMKHVVGNIKPLEEVVLARIKENPDMLAQLKPLRIQPQGGSEAARTPRVMRS